MIAEGYDGVTGYVSVLRIGDVDVTNGWSRSSTACEVAAVRIVPLPDGRVVLVDRRRRVLLVEGA